jgi:hypothetical protein
MRENPPGFVYPDWADTDELRAAYDGTLEAAHQRLRLAIADFAKTAHAELAKIKAQIERLARR